MRRYFVSASFAVLLGLVALYLVNPFRSPTWHPTARLLGWQLFRVSSAAMEPTIPVDSIVRVCFPAADIGIGDVVMFRYRNPTDTRVGDVVLVPEGRETLELKRVAAVGQSIIEISESGVQVDGRTIAPWFVVGVGGPGLTGHFEVPAGSVFVLGDNLPRSRDSRFIGSVPRAEVLGRLCEDA